MDLTELKILVKISLENKGDFFMYSSEQLKRIQNLNDLLRVFHRNGEIMYSQGMSIFSNYDLFQILRAISFYDGFNENNNPYLEKDFGIINFKNYKIIWKIDYYDTELKYHSSAPYDSTKTRRVMTVMLSDEY